jgi:diguanylate cyclase (GGDEF)-like protein
VLGVRRHAAAALAAHEHLAGVAAIAFTGATGLSDTQAEHLAVLAEYSAESLNKALLLAKEERLSVADRLTCLCTRGHFDRRLDEEFGRATKYAHPLSLMMLDLDDLKAFNDAHGRSAGDELLQRASAVIRNVLCDTDVAARYGGGRFAVLLPETGRDGAHKVAERIRHAFGEEYATVEPQSAFSCTISIGIAACPGEARTAPRLVELAELSLRRAKRNGKNLIETDRVRSADLPARPRR